MNIVKINNYFNVITINILNIHFILIKIIKENNRIRKNMSFNDIIEYTILLF